MEIHSAVELGTVWDWLDGKPLTSDEIVSFEQPVRFDFDAFRGYTGPPAELYTGGVPLMSRRLGDAILASGVDNVELYPAILRCKQTGTEYPYYVFKTVGAIEAADLGKSEYVNYDEEARIDTSFETLALDEKRARGQLFFRLAENLAGLVAHEKVCKSIADAGVVGVTFLKPEEWMQL